MSGTVLVSIGNSDDRLTQHEWHHYHVEVDRTIRKHAATVHGAWTSDSAAPWQNAAWAFDPPESELAVTSLRVSLRLVADRYRQDSVAWLEGETEFLLGLDEPARDRPIEDLVEASSLGTPAAKAARDSVDPERARRIVERADELARESGEVTP